MASESSGFGAGFIKSYVRVVVSKVWGLWVSIFWVSGFRFRVPGLSRKIGMFSRILQKTKIES